jgi:hypothetical protein
LAPVEWLLLRDVALNPFEETEERYRRLGLSMHRGTKARNALAERGLMKVLEVRRRDGRVKLFEPTAAGREFLRRRGLGMTWRHGGAVHGYWVRYAAGRLREQGWSVEIEKSIGGGATVDVVAEKDGRRIAVEVETGKSEAEHNVRRAKAAGFEEVIVLGAFDFAFQRSRSERQSWDLPSSLLPYPPKRL